MLKYLGAGWTIHLDNAQIVFFNISEHLRSWEFWSQLTVLCPVVNPGSTLTTLFDISERFEKFEVLGSGMNPRGAPSDIVHFVWKIWDVESFEFGVDTGSTLTTLTLFFQQFWTIWEVEKIDPGPGFQPDNEHFFSNFLNAKLKISGPKVNPRSTLITPTLFCQQIWTTWEADNFGSGSEPGSTLTTLTLLYRHFWTIRESDNIVSGGGPGVHPDLAHFVFFDISERLEKLEILFQGLTRVPPWQTLCATFLDALISSKLQVRGWTRGPPCQRTLCFFDIPEPFEKLKCFDPRGPGLHPDHAHFVIPTNMKGLRSWNFCVWGEPGVHPNHAHFIFSTFLNDLRSWKFWDWGWTRSPWPRPHCFHDKSERCEQLEVLGPGVDPGLNRGSPWSRPLCFFDKSEKLEKLTVFSEGGPGVHPDLAHFVFSTFLKRRWTFLVLDGPRAPCDTGNFFSISLKALGC